MVRFDELETVRSFLNQELYVVEKYHVDRREMRIIVVPFYSIDLQINTRMFIIWSIFGLVERIMKKTTSLGSESIPNVKNKNFALESFFLMISCKILKRLKNLDLV